MERLIFEIDDTGQLNADLRNVPRSYEEICEESRIAVGTADDAAWRIGDNAVEVMARYNEVTLADYAMEIGKPKGTVAEYRQMSAYFDEDARAELSEICPNITRSHMRKVLSIKDKALGRSFVEHASMRGWTVDQFGLIMKRYRAMKGIGHPRPPKAPEPVRVEFEATFVDSYEKSVVLLLPEIAQFVDAIRRNPTRITVTVTYAAPSAPG